MRSNWDFWKRWVFPAVMVAALVTTGIWGGTQAAQVRQLRRAQDTAYARSLYELTDNMGNVELGLAKLMIAGSPGVNVALLSDIARRSDGVVQNVSSLPLAQAAAGDLMGFANLVGDYCRSLLEQASRGDPLTFEQIEQLKQLHNNCALINTDLKTISQQSVSFSQMRIDSFFNWESDDLSTKLYEMNQNGPQLPTLIYDGPFSDALTGRTPKGLPTGVIDEEAAKAEVVRFLGLGDAGSLEPLGLCEGNISAYCFNAVNTQGNPVYLQVSRQGGKVIMMMEEVQAQAGTLSVEQCEQIGRDFLKDSGIEPVVSTWTQQYSNMAVINFAACDGDTTLYPDLIKVKVCMDTGAVAALDATSYYMNHAGRSLGTPGIPMDEARALVSMQLDIQREQLCVVPADGGNEKLAWEFMGKFAEETYIIYLSAENGDEIQVFKVINTETGSLTV
ncbi:MAG: germination protein YpeB [Eubacteriales bacterium]|nr:germination protein YpeB [Eubacteriales bacterium]